MDNSKSTPVRVNVPNPEYPDASDQQRVTAVTNNDLQTAHTATGAKVDLWQPDGQIRPDVIVYGK